MKIVHSPWSMDDREKKDTRTVLNGVWLRFLWTVDCCPWTNIMFFKGGLMNTKQQVRDTIIKLLKIKPDELKDNQSLEQCLGVDSTEMVEINIALTKAFGIQFEEKEVGKNNSINQIVAIVDLKKS